MDPVDTGRDEKFKGTNMCKVPIRRPVQKPDPEVEELLREPFSLFSNDPFILWRREVGSGDVSRTPMVSPVAPLSAASGH